MDIISTAHITTTEENIKRQKGPGVHVEQSIREFFFLGLSDIQHGLEKNVGKSTETPQRRIPTFSTYNQSFYLLAISEVIYWNRIPRIFELSVHRLCN